MAEIGSKLFDNNQRNLYDISKSPSLYSFVSETFFITNLLSDSLSLLELH